ncbi:hypothetical protein BD309DRAFT_414377 [Dichomitus squalens]|nr:hypothetical protein BD309DRAFT_414377 [Dichomitus squalens]
MCFYEVPVVQWLHCGHMRPMAAVRCRGECTQLRQVASSSWRAAPLGPNKCLSPQYVGRPVYAQGLCPGCAWADYHHRQEDAIARYGPQVWRHVRRPAFLIPLYSYPSWFPGQLQPIPTWGLIGLGPTSLEFTVEDRKRSVLEWVAGQTQYRYETVQESSLRALDGASLGCPPSGRIEGTRSAVQVKAANPVTAIRLIETRDKGGEGRAGTKRGDVET